MDDDQDVYPVGEWHVDICTCDEDDPAVIISFDEIHADGVTTFETGMSKEHALRFAAAIVEYAEKL